MIMERNTEAATSVIGQLNSIESAWKSQFDNEPDIQIFFAAEENGLLSVNGRPLPVATEEVDVTSISVDVEQFGFRTLNGELYLFAIQWPYEGKPHLATINHLSEIPSAS